jgi:serine/threonine-protein kinase
MINNNINQYTDISYLQRGGTSHILKGINKYNQKPCIIKLSIDSERDAHTYNEGLLLGQINHKNIVKLLDINKIHDRVYLVLELLEGKTLQDYIIQNGPISYSETIYILEQICQGLSHLHNKNIVHKDLHPRNIFYCTNGDIKILDFGLSAIKDQRKNIKAQKNIRGMIDFISPKQILNSSLTETWSDLYSLASILYFLDTGKKMFENKSLNLKIRNKLLEYYPIHKIKNLDLKELFEHIILLYEYKSSDIQKIMDLIHLKQIIDKWHYVKG